MSTVACPTIFIRYSGGTPSSYMAVIRETRRLWRSKVAVEGWPVFLSRVSTKRMGSPLLKVSPASASRRSISSISLSHRFRIRTSVTGMSGRVWFAGSRNRK
ncbi:hypothetical protein D3C76_1158210 [compost metagenome]